jgi:hypothetical protein
MKRSSLIKFELRFTVAVLISVLGLSVGLLWGGGRSLSWAAPGQNPHAQTVPTRSPTPEPEPTPPAEAPVDDEDKDDDDGSAPMPTPEGVASPSPTPSPGSTVPSQTVVESPVSTATVPEPSETEEGPQLDRETATPPPATFESGGDSSTFSSPLPTPTSDIFSSPLPSPMPGSTSPEEPDQPTPSPIPTSASVGQADESSSSQAPSTGIGWLVWLVAIGLGLVLVVAGVLIARRG